MESRRKILSEEMIAAIGKLMDCLNVLMKLNDEHQASYNELLSAIQTRTVPVNISVFYGIAPVDNLEAYALKLAAELAFELDDIILWLHCIDRYQALSPLRQSEAVRYNFVNPLNVTKLLLAAALLTYKFNHDDHYSNGYVALIAGLETTSCVYTNPKGQLTICYISKMINDLEIQFLNIVICSLLIPPLHYPVLAQLLNIPFSEQEFTQFAQTSSDHDNIQDCPDDPLQEVEEDKILLDTLTSCSSTLFPVDRAKKQSKTARIQADSPSIELEIPKTKRIKCS